MSCVLLTPLLFFFFFFFFNDTATSEIYTLSLHDALPISAQAVGSDDLRTETGDSYVFINSGSQSFEPARVSESFPGSKDRKSTRLNSSHSSISYAVFCLKKKKKNKKQNKNHTQKEQNKNR